jgi:hypothetical protein
MSLVWYTTGSNRLVSAISRNFGLEESEVEARDGADKQDSDHANDAGLDGDVCLFSSEFLKRTLQIYVKTDRL